MPWLPWLKKDQRDILSTRIKETVSHEICHRHWGVQAPGDSPGGIPRFYIMDIRGLFMAAGILRYTLNQYDTTVFYRGQRKDWETRISLLRDVKTKNEAQEREEWLKNALSVTQAVFDPLGGNDIREALLQHYGLPTTWLDVVDNVQTAAWFAYYNGNTENPNDSGERDDSSGYIYAIACPNGGIQVAYACDLRTKPSEWLRPHIQQAWAIRALKPTKELGRLHYLQVCTFIVPRTLLRQWSGYDVLTSRVMFPRENEDRGVYYWQRAMEELVAAKLYPVPWKTSVT